MNQLLEYLEAIDLRGVHALASLFGALLAAYVSQMWGTGELSKEEPSGFIHLRRASLMVLALALLWSLLYSDAKGWQPWPPHLAAIVAMDLMLASTVASALLRRWRKWQSGSQPEILAHDH